MAVTLTTHNSPLTNHRSPLTTRHTTTALDWDVIGFAECDVTAGEKYQVSGKFQDIEGCQKSCEADAGCLAITYFFVGGLCRQFSTPCTNTKSSVDAVSYQLPRTTTTTTTTTTITTTTTADANTCLAKPTPG